MSLKDIADVTRIPTRSLERLEAGEFEKLPADTFVRGFLRSYAQCVGLDVEETIRRYAECGMTPAPVSSPMANELAGSMATLDTHRAPLSLWPRRARTQAAEAAAAADASADVVAPEAVSVSGVEVVSTEAAAPAQPEAAPAQPTMMQARPPEAGAESAAEVQVSAATSASLAPLPPAEHASHTQRVEREISVKRSDRRRKRRQRRRHKENLENVQAAPASNTAYAMATQAGAAADAVASAPAPQSASQPARQTDEAPMPPVHEDTGIGGKAAESTALAGSAVPALSNLPALQDDNQGDERHDAIPAAVARSVSSTMQQSSRPVLVIDDDRPEDAAQVQEEREAARERDENSWRSFLPPSLLDTEDGSRRGTLTLAVIILVIVATLTMSYLLRSPSSTGDGVTWRGPSSTSASQSIV